MHRVPSFVLHSDELLRQRVPSDAQGARRIASIQLPSATLAWWPLRAWDSLPRARSH